jgi:hypothetical protein
MVQSVQRLATGWTDRGSNQISVVAQSKAYVCGRSPAGISGSNPVGGTDVCLLCLLYGKDKRQNARTVKKKKKNVRG